ncbi:MAG: hypothetical protein LBN19_01810 [Endomicrobium sp.]|jgi:hypothetical protein|nr:hypothetical protein [Endomicrobium sp.]
MNNRLLRIYGGGKSPYLEIKKLWWLRQEKLSEVEQKNIFEKKLKKEFFVYKFLERKRRRPCMEIEQPMP